MKNKINYQTKPVEKLFAYGKRLRPSYSRLLLTSFVSLAFSVSVLAQTTLNPVADTDTQSDIAAGTNTTLNASQWNHLMLRYDLASINGTVTTATLRVYQTSTSGAYTLNVNTTSTDSWSEGGTKPTLGTLITSGPGRTTAGYVDINVTAHVQSKMAGNKIVSVALSTNLGSWTPFFSRQNSTNKPQLVVTTTSAGPTRIQAENWSAMNGVQTETTTDTGGGLNIGWIDNADWMDYSVNFPTAGNYTVNMRIAGFGGSCQIKDGATVLSTVSIPSTGAWQTWQTISSVINIGTAGQKTIRFQATAPSWNFNWFEYEAGGSSGSSLTVSPSSLSYGSGASSQNISVTSNTSWSVTDNQSWISVSPASGSNNGTVSVSITANSGAARSGTVTITGGSITRTVSVSQSAGSTSNTMKVGTNFWFLATWSGESPFTTASPNFSAAWASGTSNYLVNTNIWSSTFIDEIASYGTLRFMDWGGTNNTDDVTWAGRKLPDAASNNEAWGGSTGGDGMAYEWMIDLCNRTNKNMWVCVPHTSDANYWTQLATLIKNRLKPSLKVYIEYSNETWNGDIGQGFTQAGYCITQGQNQGLPGMNRWYQGGAYSVWQSVKVFKAFHDVFGSEMSSKVIRVCSFSGNFDIFDQGYNDVVNSSTWNPNDEEADLFACAPYVGGGLDGASSSIQTQFREQTNRIVNEYITPAKAIANKYGKPLGCYEGGQHLYTNAHLWSRNPAIYNEYIYMLDQWKPHFTLFMHYAHCGDFEPGGSWGAKEFTGQPISEAHKYRALMDWMAANGGSGTRAATAPYNEAISIEEEEKDAEKVLSVHPNPAANIATVTLNNEYRGPVELLVVNSKGEAIKTHQSTKTAQFFEWSMNTSELTNGLYLIRVNANKRYVKKLIKE